MTEIDQQIQLEAAAKGQEDVYEELAARRRRVEAPQRAKSRLLKDSGFLLVASKSEDGSDPSTD